MKRVLMVACETERWGPSRLPQPMSEAGFEVAALCCDENPLGQSSFVAQHFRLEPYKSWRTFAKIFDRAMTEWHPDLVIPCDEPIVVMLHHLLKNKKAASRYVRASHLETLQKSIGRVEQLDAMVLKTETRQLAKSLGIETPDAQVVSSVDEAELAAEDIGFPVYVKQSFSWAGRGSIPCNNIAEVRNAFQSLHSGSNFPKRLARCILGRDWFPVNTAIEVQKAIQGESVMYSVAAREGEVVGGLFGRRSTTIVESGPSTVVQLGEHSSCRLAAETMVKAMQASGFLAFDFMICAETGKVYLLECNPRPNQVCHLGRSIGQDLCVALRTGQSIQTADSGEAESKTIPLFPQEWFRDEQSALDKAKDLDLPRNDPKLLRFMLQQGEERGKSVVRLAAAVGNRISWSQLSI